MLEAAGISPFASPGMIKNPKQMLFEGSNMMPHFANGGNITPDEMRAMMMMQGHEIPHMSIGGSLQDMLKSIAAYKQPTYGMPVQSPKNNIPTQGFVDPSNGTLQQMLARLFGLHSTDPMISYATQPEQNI